MAYELLNTDSNDLADALVEHEVGHTKASDIWAFGMTVYVSDLIIYSLFSNPIMV